MNWHHTEKKSKNTHLLTPFVHYLPRKYQKKLIRHFTIWGLIARPTREQVDDFLDEIRLLDYAEMKDARGEKREPRYRGR